MVQPAEPAGAKAVAGKEAATADELLALLETADKDLKSLKADLRYQTVSELDGDEQVRMGHVYFVTREEGAEAKSRSINVTFDTLKRGSTLTQENRSFILNRGVFVEKASQDKQINRYRLGPKGKTIDPLKIGEGPFPLPFGQKPADIKERFVVELLAGTDGMTFKSPDAGLKGYFEKTYQLKLIPRPGTKAAGDFAEARIWFQKDGLLPVQARTIKPNNSGSEEFFLWNIRRNEPVDESLFNTETPAGWQEEEKELE